MYTNKLQINLIKNMPLPSPKGKEKRADFVSRCIGDNTTTKDFPDQKQRIAVCYSQWDKAKKASAAIIGSGDNEVLIEAAQKTYDGKKRSDLKDSDFLYPEERSFPIVTPQDVKDAVSSFGRSKGKDFEDFKRRLVRKARSKGAEFISALPDTIKEQFKIVKANSEEAIQELGEEYITQAKQSVRELLNAANKVSAYLESDERLEQGIEAWVFEKIVLSKAMICSAASYLEFGENEQETNETLEEENDENTGLIEPESAKVISKDYIQEKTYNNKFGEPTY